MTRRSPALYGLAAIVSIGCSGALGDGPAGPRDDPRREPPTQELPPFEPADTGMRRLTVAQYENTVRDLLGEDIAVRDRISPDQQSEEGFELSEVVASTVTTTELDVERYDIAARAAVEVVFADAARREALVGCAPASAADPCVDEFLRGFLLRAWRRPPDDAEVARYHALAETGATELGSVWLGLRYAVATALESPYFLYRVELGTAGGFDDYELASRLSYFLWNTTPDADLLAAAARGDLRTDEGLAREADRLLLSPRSRAPIMHFFTEWLGLDALDRMSKNPDAFPAWRDELGPAMRRELEQVIEGVVFTDDASVLSLFELDHTYVDAGLAGLYGLEVEGLSTATLVEQWEAEEASPSGCADVPGYANVCSESELAREVTLASAGRHRFSVRAYGAQAGGEVVRIRISIDGATVGEHELWATEDAPEVVSVERELGAGSHRFSVAFLNDYYALPENRDLRVDWLRVEALGGAGDEWVEVPLPAERRGILTLGGILALYARPIDTSPTQRGLLVRERLLCEHIPPPPLGVDPTLPPPPAGMTITNRQRVALHLEAPECAACHDLMDPLGLPLEHFDGIGAFRETDRGLALDVSGDLDGVAFDGAIELGSMLVADPRVPECFTRLLLRRASGRHEERAQLAAVRDLSDAWAERGYSLRELTRAIVLSEAFRSAGEPR